jgi:predicted component of type VI protein secretion system
MVTDINIAQYYTKMISSRKHAVIESTKDGFALRPEKTTNSTFVNGVEVPAGETRILRDGDRVQFGFQGLELVFKAPEK